jgi:hypothetical protein
MDKNILIAIISENNLEYIRKAILEIQNLEKVDLLIIDDGSDYDIFEEIKEFKFVKCISHNEPSGYGACLAAAFIFTKNFNYKYLITLNPEENGFIKDISNIINNLDYGYDIITCSRILENSSYCMIKEKTLDIYEKISFCLKDVTEMDITDPLSPNKGYNINSIESLELTDETHGALLQLFVQGAYYGYNIIEIPAESGSSFGNELDLYNDPLDTFSIIIETEKYLYDKGSIN